MLSIHLVSLTTDTLSLGLTLVLVSLSSSSLLFYWNWDFFRSLNLVHAQSPDCSTSKLFSLNAAFFFFLDGSTKYYYERIL